MQKPVVLHHEAEVGVRKIEKYMSTIEVFQMNGIYYVRKIVQPPSIGSKRLWFLGFLARILCALETKALRDLCGLKGIVHIVRQDSPTSFISLYEEAIAISMANNLSPVYFDKLHELFQAIHKKGVVDLDLIHESDKLIDQDGNPILLDFGVAITCSLLRDGLGKRLFEFLCRQHDLHCIELKNKYFPQETTAEERRALEKPFTLLKMERAIHRLRILPKRYMERFSRQAKYLGKKALLFFEQTRKPFDPLLIRTKEKKL